MPRQRIGGNRQKYSFRLKRDTIALAQHIGAGPAARRNGVNVNTAYSWLSRNRRVQIQQYVATAGADLSRFRDFGAGRRPLNRQLEAAMTEWLDRQQALHFEHRRFVPSKLMRNTALQIYADLQTDNDPIFVASKGWLDRFLGRFLRRNHARVQGVGIPQ